MQNAFGNNPLSIFLIASWTSSFEEETPLSDAPVVEGEEVMDIVDEEVPMAEVPLVAGAEEVSVIAQTGDSNHMAAGFGGMFAALAGMFFLRKKKED